MTSPLVALLLLASSLAVLWTGGRQEAELARAARRSANWFSESVSSGGTPRRRVRTVQSQWASCGSCVL